MRLLAYLVEDRGRVRSREDLLEDVWNYSPSVSTRTIDTHVKRLRDKLGDAGAMVETVRGTGYRLSAITRSSSRTDGVDEAPGRQGSNPVA